MAISSSSAAATRCRVVWGGADATGFEAGDGRLTGAHAASQLALAEAGGLSSLADLLAYLDRES
jgi:hypothetical protein